MFRKKKKAKPYQEVWPKDILKNNINQNKPLLKTITQKKKNV